MLRFRVLWVLAALMTPLAAMSEALEYRWTVSSADGALKQALSTGAFSAQAQEAGPVVEVVPETRLQTMLGMGASLEPTTAYNLAKLSKELRTQVLRSLVHPEGLHMNLMRICIGTPDFTGDPWYTYNDMPPGEVDPDLEFFSIAADRRYILPVLREARAINPKLRFYASPWSPPGWMTSTDDMIGGHVLPEHYDAYARYFVKFIRAYEAEGIPIHAVTIQNEPGVDRSLEEDPKWHYPSCRWTGEQERDFIRSHLGPLFRKEGINTEIWCYDHNFNVEPQPGDDGIAYPTIILSDPEARQYVDAVAFHGYVGEPEGMRVFQERFPDVPMYFTEGSVFGIPGGGKLIDYLRNGAASYNAWVIMIDEQGGPNNGPFEATRTIITRDSRTNTVEYHFDYDLYHHFMHHIQPGAVRLESSEPSETLRSVAFENPGGERVLIVLNGAEEEQSFMVRMGSRTAPLHLPAAAIGTLLITRAAGSSTD